MLVASYVLGTRRGTDGAEVESIVNSALGPVCAIILITGAGGMFGGVLRASGIGQALADVLEDIGLPVIVAAFVISVLLRVAQGSATVALTTAAGLIAPVVEATDGLSRPDLALIVIAIAGGATVLSHVNDSGFWLVSRFFQMDEATTLEDLDRHGDAARHDRLRARAAAQPGALSGLRRAWDSNPRNESPRSAVFKSAAIGH